ncbi:MAG: outer rane peptidoglycan-associated protein [Bacteroidota bacterium]|jgi:outer membrane protein OmpA-like peptidoglycan-associated protein
MKLKSGLLALAVFSILLIQSSNIFAQGGGAFDDQKSIKQMTPKDRLKIANDLFDAGSFYNAIEYYKEYLADESGNPEATFKLAEAYRFSRDYRKAEDWYKRAYKADESVNILAFYYQALMMKYNGKYVEAKPIFLEFVKKYKEEEGKEIRKRARMEAAGCEDALVLMQNPLKLNVYHLGSSINNPYSDFGPAADGNDALTYATIKSDTVVAVGGPTRASYVCRIYRSTRNGSKWNKGKEYGEYINDDQEHTGNPAFSANRRVMVFSRCKEKSNVDLHITCELYMCTRSTENAKWNKPVKLGPEVNEPGSTNTQPTIGRSESGDNYLYFVSDRKSSSSQGGLDIWYASIKRDGSTGTAFNCGKKINTTEDDCTPFFDDKNGQLYFSTNGRVGMGGFDIYYAKGWGKKWESPENVGYPINSSVDDRYFTLTPNHKGGYFVSNRTGGFELKSPTCCDDIFEFKYIIDPVYAVKGYVFSTDDPEKKHPLEKVQVILLNNDQTFIGKDSSTRKRLKYFFNTQREQSYIIKVGKEGYFTSSATFTNVGKTESDTQRIDIFIKPIIIKPIKIQGLFYDFDKATLRAESGPALDTLLSFLRENPTIKIQINSHTDNKGSDEYNLKLSQARAQSVVDYLTGNGIAGERLSAKGYGETDPLVPNSNPNGTDNPENRQLNRRTEFMIIGSVEGAIITYEQGRPVVIDSTASTHELNERERNGKTRAQLNDSPDGFLDNNPNGAPIMNDDIFATEPNGEKRKIEFDDKPIEAPTTPVPVAPKPQSAPRPITNPTAPANSVNKNTEDDEDEIAPAPKAAPAKPAATPPLNTNKPVTNDDDEDDAVPPSSKDKTIAPKPTPAPPTVAPTKNVTDDEDEDEIVSKPKVEQPKVEAPKPTVPVIAPTPTVVTPTAAPTTAQPRKTTISDEDDEDESKPTITQPKIETPKNNTKTAIDEDEDETSNAKTSVKKVDDKKALKEKKKAEEKAAEEKKKAAEKVANEKKKEEEKAKKEAAKTIKK